MRSSSLIIAACALSSLTIDVSASAGEVLLSNDRQRAVANVKRSAATLPPGLSQRNVGNSPDTASTGDGPPLLDSSHLDAQRFPAAKRDTSPVVASTATAASLAMALGSGLASSIQALGVQTTGWAWSFPSASTGVSAASTSAASGGVGASVQVSAGSATSSEVSLPVLQVATSNHIEYRDEPSHVLDVDHIPINARSPRKQEAQGDEDLLELDSADAATNTSGGGSSAKSWLTANLNLYRNQIAAGSSDLDFVPDPTANGGSSAALRVLYSRGSYSLKSEPQGGASFYSQPFLGSAMKLDAHVTPFDIATGDTSGSTEPSRPQLLLSYSVYFPANFDFVEGGKLPGVYSSVGVVGSDGAVDANTDGCSGGSLGGAGESCWSARVMWRSGGLGEIYAYIPTKLSSGYDLCANAQSSTTPVSSGSVICNSDYGTSIGRGAFSFVRGQWNRIAVYAQINSPKTANGILRLYVNGSPTPSIEKKGLVLRSSTVATARTGQGGGSQSSSKRDLAKRDVWDSGNQKWVDKVFFSTFFGGSSADYAASAESYSYFKDFAFFAGNNASTEAGPSFNAGSSAARVPALSLLLTAVSTLVVVLHF